MENTVNEELNDNVREAMKQGLPPFNTKKQDAIIGPVNINGVPSNGVPINGVDFINSYYNSINGKNGAEKGNKAETATQNGYIPYQSHEEKPKNIDKFLVEEYGNIMNASLTGTPYSGSVTPAQLKTLSSGIEAKMANDPAYMSGIVNQAHQNVLGFNYMPYDKEDFISRAQDPSSREYKMLNDAVEKHLNDIIKKNKMSFNGEFQELSKDLTDKYKKAEEEKKPSARTTSNRTPAAKTTTAKTTPAKTTTAKTTPAKTTTAATKTTAVKTPAGRTSGGRTIAAKKDEKPSVDESTAKQPPVSAPADKNERTTAARTTTGRTAGGPGRTAAGTGRTTGGRTTAAERHFVREDAENREERPFINPDTQKTEERPSFVREVSEFVRKNIVERNPSLILADTFLGTIVEKAKKIVRTGKNIATGFVIATKVMAQSLQMPTVDHLSKIKGPYSVTVNVKQNELKPPPRGTVKAAAHGPVKTEIHVRQPSRAKCAARR